MEYVGLDQQIVGATSLNAFKNGLDELRKTKLGFFMDCSAKPYASGWFVLLVRPYKMSYKVSLHSIG